MEPVELVELKKGGDEEGAVFDPRGHRPTRRGLASMAALSILLGGAMLGVAIVPRMHRASMLEVDERRAAAAVPRVSAARAERAVSHAALALPGTVEALQETSIYARANGYVRTWRVDIGARVKRGQVLVELEVPDLDQQLHEAQAVAAQAEAGIAQAKTQLELARITNRRFSALGPSGVVTQQEVDQYQAAFDAQLSNVVAAEAALGSAKATVARYRDLQSFARITAPFDGVITMRGAEVGQLVVACTAQGQALFKVAEVDIVRVFVNVPQLYAGGIQVGMDAPTTIREAPGRAFAGKVARTSSSLDYATRSLLTEVDIPNPDGALLAGMYAQVSFDVSPQDRPVLVPATSVLFDARGTRVASIRDGVVHWVKVEIGSDLGDRLALASGVAEGELVAKTPTEQLHEGMRVEPQDASPGEAPEVSSK